MAVILFTLAFDRALLFVMNYVSVRYDWTN
jgi:hypothetical protein